MKFVVAIVLGVQFSWILQGNVSACVDVDFKQFSDLIIRKSTRHEYTLCYDIKPARKL